ncbi:MAG: hypothetical protein OEQ13_06315, partial [Acidobacteriota bacterium]|nr:hypothetical protein [Acidobacteriota bacterium]
RGFGAAVQQSDVSLLDFPYWRAGIDGDGVTITISDSGASADAGDLSDTRADSGWVSDGSATSMGAANCANLTGPEDGTTGQNNDHRKIACYSTNARYGSFSLFPGDVGNYRACDSSDADQFSHGGLSAAAALGNATRGKVPVSLAPDPDAPSPTDSSDSTYFRNDSGGAAIAYGAGFYNDGAGGTANKFSEVDTSFDGVAKGARMVFVDMQNSCGTLAVATGNLGSGIVEPIITNTNTFHGATIHNFSWGSFDETINSIYTGVASAIDAAVWDDPVNFVTVAAGNAGTSNNLGCMEGFGNIDDFGACKNCVPVGMSSTGGTALDTGTSEGPSIRSLTTGGRIAPRLLGVGGLEYGCRNEEGSGVTNNQTGAASCELQQAGGTSFASPNLAGAGAIVQEYFAEGFYPSGSANTLDKVPVFSSALTQAIMVASANPVGDRGHGSNTDDGIGNNSWGWGSVRLNNALPLASDAGTVSGLIVHDQDDHDGDGTLEGVSNLSLSPTITGTVTNTNKSEFEVLADDEDLNVALVWYEPETSEDLINDLDLVVTYCGADGDCATTGDNRVYMGNAFHEDNDQNCSDAAVPGRWDLDGDGTREAFFYTVDNTAIQNGITNQALTVGLDEWEDRWNNVERVRIPAVGNEPDFDADGTGDWPNVVAGTWEVRVDCEACPGTVAPAVAITGPVAAGSSIRLSKNPVACVDELVVTVSEVDDANDPLCKASGCTSADVGSRVYLEVLDTTDTVVDTIYAPSFTGTLGTPPPVSLRHLSASISISNLLHPNSWNSSLELDDGYTIRAVYEDDADGTGTDVVRRVSQAVADCRPDIEVGLISQIGQNSAFLFVGGCDDDTYLDEDEFFSLSVSYFNLDDVDLVDPVISLLACNQGTYSAATDSCTASSDVTVHNPEVQLSLLPGLTTQLTRFSISINADSAVAANRRKEVDFAICLTGASAGQPVRDCEVKTVLLNADDETRLYSTDCPTGCTVSRYDRNFDEKYDESIPESVFDPFSLFNVVREGLDETNIVYSNMLLAGDEGIDTDNDGTVDIAADGTADCLQNGNNFTCGQAAGFKGPWTFDSDRENFTVGVSPSSTNVNALTLLTQLGEDQNWNDTIDPGEDVQNAGTLDYGWGTGGGCGYSTASGCWHTGDIGSGGVAGTSCRAATAGNESICELADVNSRVPISLGQEFWFDTLRSEVVHPVHLGAHPDGFDWDTQILDWSWNFQTDINDDGSWTWGIDLDVTGDQSIQLGDEFIEGSIESISVGLVQGGQLEIFDGGMAWQLTDDVTGSATYGDAITGTVGGNRAAKRGCYFEQLDLIGEADVDGDGTFDLTGADRAVNAPKPVDDDCDNEFDLGPDGCPGTCLLDDDGNGLVDDFAEICPCQVCTSGTRAGFGCAGDEYCTSGGQTAPRCNTRTDGNIIIPAGAPGTGSDKRPGTPGTPIAWGDDLCGDGTTDEGVFAAFVPGASNSFERQTRNVDTTIANSPEIRFTTLEDLWGPAGDSWQGEIGFISWEPAGAADALAYGIAIDDMVMEWQETHPIPQLTDTCASDISGMVDGQCASIGLGATANTFEADTRLPVSVIDPHVRNAAGTFTNLGLSKAQSASVTVTCTASQVMIEAYSEAELNSTLYCLDGVDNSGDGTLDFFSGNIKTTTQVRNINDDLVFLSFDGADTPSIVARYIDRWDGLNGFDVGPDGQEGVAGFDDDNDGTVDEADELCPEVTVLGPGRSPHNPGSAARWSDDVCGCKDNPIVDATLATFDPIDIVITQVLVREGDTDGDGTLESPGDDGDGDNIADPGELMVVDLMLRNQSGVDVGDITLKISSGSPQVGCLDDDLIFIESMLANDDAPGGPDEVFTRTLSVPDSFSFRAGNTATRSSLGEDFSSLFTVSLAATAKASQETGVDEDFPLSGTFIVQDFTVPHNLDIGGTIGTAIDFVNDFEAFLCTSGTNKFGGAQFGDEGAQCRSGGSNYKILEPANGTTTSVACTGTLPNGQDCSFGQFEFGQSGDQAKDFDGTRCTYNDPSNPFGNNYNPADFCELGEGFDTTAASNWWHLHGPGARACNGKACPTAGANDDDHSRGTGSNSLHLAFHDFPQTTGAWYDGATFHQNRMRWAETALNFQLGLGADHPSFTADPVLSYWTQM